MHVQKQKLFGRDVCAPATAASAGGGGGGGTSTAVRTRKAKDEELPSERLFVGMSVRLLRMPYAYASCMP